MTRLTEKIERQDWPAAGLAEDARGGAVARPGLDHAVPGPHVLPREVMHIPLEEAVRRTAPLVLEGAGVGGEKRGVLHALGRHPAEGPAAEARAGRVEVRLEGQEAGRLQRGAGPF